MFAFVAVTLDVLAIVAEVSRGTESLGAHQTTVDTCCLHAVPRLVDIVTGLRLKVRVLGIEQLVAVGARGAVALVAVYGEHFEGDG